MTKDGKPVNGGIFGSQNQTNKYFAYGIRNSFGMDFDPVTGNLWDTENGPQYGDEINLVYQASIADGTKFRASGNQRDKPQIKSLIYLRDFSVIMVHLRTELLS